MAAHDVFVFPSLFEGFGLVLLEAMAMGLPVITTPHTAGPDLIREGMEGFIVPIRHSTAIAERLEQLPPRACEAGRHVPSSATPRPFVYLDKLRGDPGGMCRPARSLRSSRFREGRVKGRGGEWSTESEDVGIPSWEFRLQGGASLRNLCRTV